MVLSKNKLKINAYEEVKIKDGYYYINNIKNNYAFSGTAFTKDMFIFGEEDIKSVDSLEEVCGDYTLLTIIDNTIVFTNDFFGIQKIYYYNSKDVYIFSNRLHLIFKILKEINLNLKPNYNLISALLASGESQPFSQIFTNKLFFENLYILNVDKKIVIKDGVVSFVSKEIGNILLNRTQLSEKEYQNRLKKGADDIKHNFNLIYNNPRFKKILVDLTGGMDSRVIFSAVNNFSKDKVFINACNTISVPKDILVATTLNQYYNYPYDNISERKIFTKKSELLNEYFSKIFGNYFAYDPRKINNFTSEHKETINITGFYGEITLRPYYSRNYVNNELSQVKDLKKFVDFFVDNENHHKIGTAKEIESLKTELYFSLKSIQANSPIEKYDLLYLYYRNGLHCTDTYRFNGQNTPRVSIIQSKELFYLKINQFKKLQEQTTLLQNGVISHLNPLNLFFDYASEKDTMDLENVRENIELLSCFKNLAKMEINDRDAKEPDLCRLSKYIEIENDLLSNFNDIDINKILSQSLYNIVWKYRVISEDFGKCLFMKLSSGSNISLMNKIMMLNFQLEVLGLVE